MFESFSTRGNRRRTYVLLLSSGVFLVVGLLVGIDDNLPGVASVYLSSTLFVAAVAHPWRRARNYWRLFYGSTFGLVFFAVLHNVFESFASDAETTGALQRFLEGAGVASFLVATFIFPAAILIGVVGALLLSRREHHPHSGGAAGTTS